MEFIWKFPEQVNSSFVTTAKEALKSIPLRNEAWLCCLIAFHVVIPAAAILLRKSTNLIACFLLILLSTLLCSERLNEFCASHWDKFATEQYFDSHGYFFFCFWNLPTLFNCILLVVLLLSQMNTLLAQAGRLNFENRKQLKQKNEWQLSRFFIVLILGIGFDTN